MPLFCSPLPLKKKKRLLLLELQPALQFNLHSVLPPKKLNTRKRKLDCTQSIMWMTLDYIPQYSFSEPQKNKFSQFH